MAGSRTLKLSILADVDNLKKNLDAGSKEVEGFGGKLEKFGKVAAAAFAAAAAAAAAYAGKLAIEGVKAAIEDEAAQTRLANALKNVTGATQSQIDALEDQISQMSLAFGVADDQLRPAYQRLATATGSLEEAEKGLQLALDISAATGKSVETVANALGKAYEGNTASLARLGIGLSAAEIKTLGLDGTMQQLSDTFGGSATKQADTLEGRIARLSVRFDEAKESVGAGLLPIVERLITYIVDVFIPKLEEAKDKALKPIQEAFENNRDSIEKLWRFTKQYLIPLFETTFVSAIAGVGRAIGGIVNIVGNAIEAIENLVRGAIDAINTLIRLVNNIPGVNIQPIATPSFLRNQQQGGRISSSTGSINIPTPFQPTASEPNLGGALGSAQNAPGGGSTGGARSTGTRQAEATEKAAKAVEKAAEQISEFTWMNRTGDIAAFRASESGDVINMPASVVGGFDPGRFRAREEGITININGAIDPSSTARQVAQILNTEAATSGSFTNLGVNRFALRPE